MKMQLAKGIALSLFIGVLPEHARSDESVAIKLTVKDGKFFPEEITGPANSKFKLIVTNEGTTAEEFESVELNREKVIAPGKSVTIFLGPLEAGTFPFFGEFHPKTAKGVLIIK